MKTIILYGLRRSGNHFLISTILQQFSNYVHMNNVSLSYDEYIKNKNIKKNKERCDGKWTGFKDVECVIISLENKTIDNNVIDNFKKIDNCYFLLLLRCPYSHFSSVWKVYNQNTNSLIEIIELWKIYAKYFIDNNNKFIKVLYDKFCCSEDYMYNIIEKLDIDNIKNIDVNKYIRFQESSFRSNSSEKKKQLYKTLENCVYHNDEQFLKLVNNKEIHDLWELIKK